MIAALALIVAACGDGADIQPIAERAEPMLEAGYSDAFGPVGQGAVYRPGTGPVSFVGRWADDVSVCTTEPGGPGTPIQITIDLVRGDGIDCRIDSIHQEGDSYGAELSCPSRQVVRLTVTDGVLTALYLAPEIRRVTLNKCTTLTDTNPDEGLAPRVRPPA